MASKVVTMAEPVKGEVVASAPRAPQGPWHQTSEIEEGVVMMPWPAKLCCYDNCNCCADLPLCCYAAWCGPCLWSELAEHLAINPVEDMDPECCPSCLCCTSRKCATLYWALYGATFLTGAAQGAVRAVGLDSVAGFINLAPCLTMKTRQVLEKEHGLEVQCKNAYCADYWCGNASTYQQAVYVKHVMKKDYACSAYKDCQTCCCCGLSPAPGDMILRLPLTANYATITSQPTASVV